MFIHAATLSVGLLVAIATLSPPVVTLNTSSFAEPGISKDSFTVASSNGDYQFHRGSGRIEEAPAS